MHLAPLSATHSTDGFTWRAPMPPYQQVGIARLLAEPGVLLADEMGLGKTIQAIGAWSWCWPGWCWSGAASCANGRRN